jgi:pimeloyl-ACP methyl ester carboxylesterase
MLALLWVACREEPVDPPVEVVHLEPVAGNPLVPGVPLYPWPSDLYLQSDAATPSGFRLSLPEGLASDKIDVGVVNEGDGFSRAAPLLAWLEGGVDPASLPDLAGSVSPESPVMLVRADDLSLVPVLAELDGNAVTAETQALILRPQVTLQPASRYVVLLRDSLRTADGGTHAPEDAFRALRDALATDDDVVEGMRADFEVVRETIAGLGLAPEEVVLGWSFRTRSEQDVTGTALALQDVAGAFTLEPWTLSSDTTDAEGRRIEGTFLAPDFLGPDEQILLDASGAPVQHGVREVPFLLSIPPTVSGPRPVVVFGHGFFSAKEEITWGSFSDLVEEYGFSAIAVDFIGFNESDLASSAAALGGDLGELRRVVDEQLQSQVHFTLLARLVQEQLASEYVELDPDRIRYMGASNGGTQGAVIVSTSPVLRDGVLVVPGGGWSHMIQRAVQWNDLGSLYALNFPNPIELQLSLAISQQVFDKVDSINFDRGLAETPFEGRSPGQVQLHMAVGDAQVSNMVTEWLARTAQIPLVTPSPREIWGLAPLTLPPAGDNTVPRALFVYDEGYPPEVDDNVAPLTDNGSHASIRTLDSYKQQVAAFLEDKTFLHVCEGACDPD